MKWIYKTSIVLLTFGSLMGCKKETPVDKGSLNRSGTGQYIYTDYEPFKNKPITCFYHIPENSTPSTPILIVLPGGGREAESLRNSLIGSADQKGFIVLSLLFPTTYFPGSDAYNLGNIFEDGDNPDATTLNPQDEWTFSVIDPIFEDFKKFLGSNATTYDITGFSAGAQMLHRFLIFSSSSSYKRAAVGSAGWYNLPDDAVEFPYGLKLSPMEGQDLSLVFAKQTYVIVGAKDSDPNAANLRHNPQADAQGDNRVARAQYFYQESRTIAVDKGLPINWAYQSIPNVGHDGAAVMIFVADLLY